VLIRRGGDLPASAITPESTYLNRRAFVAAAGGVALGALLPPSLRALAGPDDLKPTSYKIITTYNNYYEFGTSKESPAELAGSLRVSPWTVEVSGEAKRTGRFDYDDLIYKARDLLSDTGEGLAAWVLFKLDGGLDHILIDEAQDTSPKQWEIIRAIASEFMPGGSRPNVKRTLFAVGDEKQSIFSFQGSEPRAFDEMRHVFERQFDRPELGWKHLRFHHSFRSGANVLGSVDRVFKAPDIYVSVTTDEIGIPEHQPLPDAAPGLVELWPLIEPAERREIEGWDAPFDTESEQSPRVKLAQRIADHEKRWMARGQKPNDVLVLVRQRGPLFEAIIRALKSADVPVAGADRLVLTKTDLTTPEQRAMLIERSSSSPVKSATTARSRASR